MKKKDFIKNAEWIIQHSHDEDQRIHIANDIRSVDAINFHELFNDKNASIRMNAITNPKAVKLFEYRKLFTDKNWINRYAVASNENAIRYKEYKLLFNDDNQQIKDRSCSHLKEYQKYHHIKKKKYGCE